MKITHAKEGQQTGSARGGEREFRTLLIGEEFTPDNYRLMLSKQTGQVSSPRHRHNFDQIRMCLEGQQNYGPDRWIMPGEIAYFPEGAYYGPEDSNVYRYSITVQCGGASGGGFVSSKRLAMHMEELKAFGTFEKGVYTRTGDLPPGTKRNQDSFEAIWEHVNGRKLEYPAPRYPEPILLKPQNFSWIPVRGQPGVARKRLGVFSERGLEIAFLQVAAGAVAQLAPRPAIQLGVVLSGEGQVGEGELFERTGFSLDPREGTTIKAAQPIEMLHVTLHSFEGRAEKAA